MLCCATTDKAFLLVPADNSWREEKGRAQGPRQEARVLPCGQQAASSKLQA